MKYLVVLITDSNYVEKTVSCMKDLAATVSGKQIDFEVVGIELSDQEKDSISRSCNNRIKIFDDVFPSWSKSRSHVRDYASGCRALHINRILKENRGIYEFLMYSDVDYTYAPEFDLEKVAACFKDYKIMLRSSAVIDKSRLPESQNWRSRFPMFLGANEGKVEIDFWQQGCEDFNGNAGLIFFKFDEEIVSLTSAWHSDIEKANWDFPCDQTTLIRLLKSEIPKNENLWRAIPRIFYRDFHHEQFSRYLLKGLLAKNNNTQIDEIINFLKESNLSYE